MRMGAERVSIVYRRTENEMPARREELHHAKEEGVELFCLHAPLACEGHYCELPTDMAIVAVGTRANPLLPRVTPGLGTVWWSGSLTGWSAIAEFEREIICERTRAGLDAARARDRRGGRPRSLSEKDLKEAKALLADPEITVEAVARRLGVGPSTRYRYLPAARQSIQEDKG